VIQADEELQRLDSLARELAAVGSTKLMVDALSHLQAKQEAARSREGNAEEPRMPSLTADEKEAKEVCIDVFYMPNL
jgi:hypothetical protein